MLVAGIDIGSRISKGVIMGEGKILSYSICDTRLDSVETAMRTMNEAMNGTGLSLKDMRYIVATGYGRVLAPFANEIVSEITCHAKGVHWYFPSARTIIDIGGQDTKGINCDENGRVTGFVMNDKCAGGTGRFLETMADVMGIPLEEIGELSLQSKQPLQLNTHCVVYEKSEALLQLKRGVAKSDILAGIHDALATRVLDLLAKISIEKEFVFAGGVSKNIGMARKLQEKIGLEPLIAPEPLILGAVGAALIASEKRQSH